MPPRRNPEDNPRADSRPEPGFGDSERYMDVSEMSDTRKEPIEEEWKYITGSAHDDLHMEPPDEPPARERKEPRRRKK